MNTKNNTILHLLENIDKSPLPVFSEVALAFLDELSTNLLSSKNIRIYPDITAFAFWARRKNIENIKNNFSEINAFSGRGLCFHICPSNIAINFAFSFVFGLLAGNANIVRIPSKQFEQVDFLLEIIEKLIKKYPSLDKRNVFISYERQSTLTEEISAFADVRMIWGGDATISQLKRMQTKALCLDIVFADRYSLCIIDENAILASGENTLKKLSEDFYNDTFLMDQNACSSPQLVLWKEASLENAGKGRELFWKFVEKVSEKYILQDLSALDKYTKLCEEIINLEIYKTSYRHTNKIYRIELSKLDKEIVELRGNSGYFYEYVINSFENELFPLINEKYQTITYFGIDANALHENMKINNIKGIDQIVPIGKALEMDVFWDGYDIIKMLANKRVIK